MPKLNDIYDNWYSGGGVFSNFPESYTPPWGDVIDAQTLDYSYHGARSGGKLTSPFLGRLADAKPETYKSLVSDVLIGTYAQRWAKLYATLGFDYDPIANVDGTETEIISESVTDTAGKTETETRNLSGSDNATRTPNLTYTKGTTDTETRNLSGSDNATRTPNTTNTHTVTNMITGVENEVYAEDSPTAVPSSDTTTTVNGVETNAETGTETNNHTISDTGTVTHANTGSDTETGTETNNHTISDTGTVTRANTGSDSITKNVGRTVTRKGNIGVTMTQQMIVAERDVWLWNFFDVVFTDIDRLLTISIY